MSFYLRKAFSFGPIRLNLSKSGITPSVGVRGARVGLRAGGRPYIHAGRHGLYYRKTLPAPGRGGSRSPTRPGRPAGETRGRAVLYEDTGLTYRHADPGAEHASEPVDPPPDRGHWHWLGSEAALVALVVLALATSGPIRWAAAIAALVPLALLVRAAADRRATRQAALELEQILARLRPGDELPNTGAWRVDPSIRTALTETTYERWAGDIAVAIATGEATDAGVLDVAGERLGVPADRRRAIEQAIYRAALLEAVADHELSESEEAALESLRNTLRIPPDAEDDGGLLDRFRALRAVRAGDLPVRATTVPLQRNEVCHLDAPGRLLREQNLRTFQRDGVRHVVRGLVLQREGSLVVTDRRVLLAGDGVFSIPFARITDIEVDADENLIMVQRDTVMTPTILSTPDAILAGAILATAAGH